MNRARIGMIAVCFLTVFAVTAMSEVNMQEGNWEMTMQIEMKGMPFKMPPVQYTVCLTRSSMNPQKDDKEDCTLISSKVQGSTYSWVMECRSEKGLIKSNGTITYNGSVLDGIINSEVDGMTMKQMLTGRRTGACKSN